MRKKQVLLRAVVAILTVSWLAAAVAVGATVGPAQTPGGDGLAEEQAEMAAETAARAQVQDMAERFGVAPLSRISYMKNKVWEGEIPFGPHNDWEPDIAADPSSPYVYVFTTEFGNKACDDCPNPAFVYRVSDDNGATWGPQRYLAKFKGDVPAGGWQYDPTVVVDNNGKVYVSILAADWGTWVMTSTDHGQTWTAPIDSTGGVGWSDHGFLTVSPDGQDVYVAYNKADSYVVASHDGGVTWGAPVRTNPTSEHGTRYYYHYHGTVLPDGTVVIPTGSTSNRPYATGDVPYFALRSTDGGVTWEQISIATFRQQPPCPKSVNYGCHADHFGVMSSVASDAEGNLMYVMGGSVVPTKGQAILYSTSTDGGLTWSSPRQLSPTLGQDGRRVVASFPQVRGRGNGDFRVAWMDNRNGIYAWDTWYTSTQNFGKTWTKVVRISDATRGAVYKNPAGYDADYGDYIGLAIMSNGRTIATWAEGNSYYGPGGTWINRE